MSAPTSTRTSTPMSAIRAQLFRFATPLTAGLFLVSTVSGAALFFHVGSSLFHSMHEVLSMVLLVPIVLHLWRNWKPMVNYFHRSAMPIALAVSLAAGGYFAYGSMNRTTGGNPAFALVNSAQSVPLASLAPVLQLDEAVAVQRLQDAGIAPVAATESISDIATRSGRDTFEILGLLTRKQ